MPKTIKKAKKKTKKAKKQNKKIDIYDVDHPIRRTAIDIIECIIEPLLQRGINGSRYYQLEDKITLMIEKKLQNYLKTPMKADLSRKLQEKLDNMKMEDADFDPFDKEDYEEDEENEFDFDSW